MIDPNATADEILEIAAQAVEQVTFLENVADMHGARARKRRDREDAGLRYAVISDTRKAAAEQIRNLKGSRKTDGLVALRRIAELDHSKDHAIYVREAWPLTWAGWVTISAVLTCNSNTIPPETSYRIALTEKGRQHLASGIEVKEIE